MTTFNEMAQNVRRDTNYYKDMPIIWKRNAEVLALADRNYSPSNLSSEERNYLEDFLAEFGERNCYQMITCSVGDAHIVGAGVYFLDPKKIKAEIISAIGNVEDINTLYTIGEMLGVV